MKYNLYVCATMSPKPVIIATLLLVVFKLTKYCDWSWWVVFFPLLMFVLITVVAIIVDMCIKIKEPRKVIHGKKEKAHSYGRYEQRKEYLKNQKATNQTPEKPFQ